MRRSLVTLVTPFSVALLRSAMKKSPTLYNESLSILEQPQVWGLDPLWNAHVKIPIAVLLASPQLFHFGAAPS